MKTKERITKLLTELNRGLYEREDVLSVALLAALSGQNLFLLGPPGTAKSLISRRLSHAFETERYFEYLMQRFSTPEEIFGPVSIAKLKQDEYSRKIEGFLPEADFAFLDEIWKSSPAILNTLLTIINEKRFRNGTKVEKVPLKALIAASNETPPVTKSAPSTAGTGPAGQGLEALYDRFVVRLDVAPLREPEHFDALLQAAPATAEIAVPNELKITTTEWESWTDEIEKIKLSPETLDVIHNIRLSLADRGGELGIYISDRLWQKAAMLVKAAAFFCGRKGTNLVDALLLRHCLWSTNENREEIMTIVEDAVRDAGVGMQGLDTQALEEDLERLEQEIKEDLFHPEDVYDTDEDGNFRVDISENDLSSNCEEIYISVNEMKNGNSFHPTDSSSNEVSDLTCNFDRSKGQFIIEDSYKDQDTYTPKVLIHKGTKKDVSKRLIDSLKRDIEKQEEKINNTIPKIEEKKTQLQREMETPFVPELIRDIAIEAVDGQLEDMRRHLKDCERLRHLLSADKAG